MATGDTICSLCTHGRRCIPWKDPDKNQSHEQPVQKTISFRGLGPAGGGAGCSLPWSRTDLPSRARFSGDSISPRIGSTRSSSPVPLKDALSETGIYVKNCMRRFRSTVIRPSRPRQGYPGVLPVPRSTPEIVPNHHKYEPGFRSTVIRPSRPRQGNPGVLPVPRSTPEIVPDRHEQEPGIEHECPWP